MLDKRIKFRHLQCFLTVAQQRSLQKASEILSISQPAVSNTIKELEEILDARLFDRNRKGTVLTQQAETFFTHAEACVNSLQQAANSMSRNRSSGEPVIRIGTAPALTASFLPEALIAFRQRVPNIQVNVLTGTTMHLMTQLRAGEFDFVLCRYSDPEQTAGLSFEYLYADPLVVVVRPGHPLLNRESGPGRIETDGVCPFTAILPLKTSINRPAVDAFAVALGIGPITDFVESLSIFLGRSLILKSDAIWFAPWSAVEDDVAAGTLVKLLPAVPSKVGKVGKAASPGLMARSVGLMMRTNSKPSAQTQILVEAIRGCALIHRTEVF